MSSYLVCRKHTVNNLGPPLPQNKFSSTTCSTFLLLQLKNPNKNRHNAYLNTAVLASNRYFLKQGYGLAMKETMRLKCSWFEFQKMQKSHIKNLHFDCKIIVLLYINPLNILFDRCFPLFSAYFTVVKSQYSTV